MKKIGILCLSLLLVYRYGLIGVVLGTVISIAYRIVVFSLYAEKNIIHRSRAMCLKRFVITSATIIITYVLSLLLPIPAMTTYANWTLYALNVTAVSVLVTLCFNMLFYRKEVSVMGKKLLRIAKRMIGKR